MSEFKDFFFFGGGMTFVFLAVCLQTALTPIKKLLPRNHFHLDETEMMRVISKNEQKQPYKNNKILLLLTIATLKIDIFS